MSTVLAACSTLAPKTRHVAFGPDNLACVGAAPTSIVGFDKVTDEELLKQALKPSGKGGVCSAAVFRVTKATDVYRVYDATNGASNYGRWWSFEYPTGPRDAYRAINAICEEWGPLDRLIACEVRTGSEVVVGTTQSVSCKNADYPKNNHLQVFIPNDKAKDYLAVENCRDKGAWPQ